MPSGATSDEALYAELSLWFCQIQSVHRSITTSPDTGADNWWLVGDNWLVAVCWWQLVGASLWVAIGWWQSVGGNWLVIGWWKFVGDNWWVAIG